jgi:hypothetical protein
MGAERLDGLQQFLVRYIRLKQFRDAGDRYVDRRYVNAQSADHRSFDLQQRLLLDRVRRSNLPGRTDRIYRI